MKRKVTHPNFYLGLISFILLFAGVGLRANGLASGDYVLGAGVLLGGIHWIWSIIDAFSHFRTGGPENRRIIWVILVVVIPPIGGMLFYLLGQKVRM